MKNKFGTSGNLWFQTPRLILRLLREEDLEPLLLLASEKGHLLYLLYGLPDSKEAMRAFLLEPAGERGKKKPACYPFGVLYEGELIGLGTVSLDEDRREGELSWIIRQKDCAKGFGTETAASLVEFCRRLGLEKVVAHCDWRNVPSRRVMEKAGLLLEDADGFRTYPKTGERARELRYGLVLAPGKSPEEGENPFS